jgi:hypothetical protein
VPSRQFGAFQIRHGSNTRTPSAAPSYAQLGTANSALPTPANVLPDGPNLIMRWHFGDAGMTHLRIALSSHTFTMGHKPVNWV